MKLFLITILFSISTYAQFSIKGTIDPDHNYSWILLYKLENGRQEYVNNATVENGKFEFKIGETDPTGIYRAYYQIENNLYVEFIYNKENIEFSFNPNKPVESIVFSRSDDNKIYQKYYKFVSAQQGVIDSLQVVYFRSKDPKLDRQTVKNYQRSVAELQKAQTNYEEISKGKIAYHFIKASAQYYAPSPFKNPQDYIEEVKLHFFDAIDMTDQVLSNSTFINDRLLDYVFYLNQANSLESRNRLQKEAIENSIQRISKNFNLQKNFEESLLQKYAQNENIKMIEFVIKNYYNLLPDKYQDIALMNKIQAALKTVVGAEAPDFSWEENGINKNLYSQIGSEYYIVVFFSSGCPHCQKQIPEFYTFIKDVENVRVIAIGLEDEKEPWEKMISNFNEFTNILDLDKWNSKKAKDYGISSIPSYFVLDANKTILAKPNDFEDLKAMFETR
jgi:thiol-disulfide isomerase/thioredoxin